MAPVSIDLRWKAHSAAVAGTQYEIRSDVAAPNDYQIVTTRPATTTFAPTYSVLSGAIVAGAGTLTLADATGFAANEYVNIDREALRLGTKTGSSFNDVVGGQYITIPQPHKDGSFVYRMHEQYTVPGVDFGSRHVVRYRIIAILAGARVVAAEAVAVQPSPPATNDKSTIWGIQDRLDGTPNPGVSVVMTIDPKAYSPGTAETIDIEPRTIVTDQSGYWEFTTHKDVARVGGVIMIKIDNITYVLKSIPDVDTICYLECI